MRQLKRGSWESAELCSPAPGQYECVRPGRRPASVADLSGASEWPPETQEGWGAAAELDLAPRGRARARARGSWSSDDAPSPAQPSPASRRLSPPHAPTGLGSGQGDRAGDVRRWPGWVSTRCGHLIPLFWTWDLGRGWTEGNGVTGGSSGARLYLSRALLNIKSWQGPSTLCPKMKVGGELWAAQASN